MKTSSKKWQKIRKIKGLRQFVTWYPRHVSENPGFKATDFCGTVISSDEGDMEWIDIDDLSKVNVVEDFYDLLKVLNDPDINEFQYTIEDDEWIVHLK